MVAAAKKRTVERKRSGYISNMIHNPWLYVMALPVIAYYIIFHYLPMYGVVIAFKDYVPARGIWESGWVGFKADWYANRTAQDALRRTSRAGNTHKHAAAYATILEA